MLSRLQKITTPMLWLATVLIVSAGTMILLWVQQAVARAGGDHVTRPFTIGFVLVIGLVTVIGGRWNGFLALILSVLASVFVLPPHGYHDVLLYPRNQVETCLLLVVGGTQIVGMTMLRQNRRLRSLAAVKEHDLGVAQQELIESERRRLAFSREVLLATTGGRLNLCDDEELYSLVPGEAALTVILKEYADVSALRRQLKEIMAARGLYEQRQDDLSLCVTEAGTNAIKHGNGGTAQVWMVEGKLTEAVVVVKDHGTGIPSQHLARATLERGFSTQVSLGMGFFMMLESADNLALSTSAKGTAIMMRVGNHPRRSVEDSMLASFNSLGVAEAV